MITKSDFLTQCFLIEKDDLETFDHLFNKLPGDKEFSVRTTDGFSRTYESIDEIYTATHPIEEIEIKKSSYSPIVRISLSFKNTKYSSIYYSIHSEEEKYLPTIQSILEKVGGTKPWYNRFAHTDFVSLSLLGFVMLIITLWLILALGFVIPLEEETTPKEDAISKLVSLAIIAFIPISGWLLNKLRNFLFPIGTFAFGQGKKQHNLLEKIRWTVFVGGIVGILVAITF